MDLDLLSDILTDHQPALTGNLLSHLPDKLTNESTDTYVGSSHGIISHDQNLAGAVISKIEDIFESIADSILHKDEMTIKIKTRKTTGKKAHNAETGVIETLPDEIMRSVKFPSTSPNERWKFGS